MSIQTLDGSSWGDSAARSAVRRTIGLLVLVLVIVGPLMVGGALGWMATREPGPTLGNDGWLRTKPTVAVDRIGFPMVSTSELSAAGVSVDDASKILKR